MDPRHDVTTADADDVLFFLLATLNAAILIAFPEALSIQQVGTFRIEHVCDSQSVCGFLCATVLRAVFRSSCGPSASG